MRWIRGLAVLGLVACRLEYQPQQELPQYPSAAAPPVEAAVQEDRITQVVTPIVDVLFTIDNSCSMEDEQDAVSANFPTFMDYFDGSGLDFHVGVLSTDLASASAGKLREVDGVHYIDVNTPEPSEVFTLMATMGTDGAGQEKGLG